MATKIGITNHLGGITTPREHWDLVVGGVKTGDPPLPHTLFTASRSSGCDAMEDIFNGKIQRLFLFAESELDVEDFVSGYLASLGSEGRVYANRCLFIDDEDAWRSVVEVRKRHVLVASPKLGLDSENNMDLQTVATNKGHSVIIPLCGAWSGDRPGVLKLRSPSRAEIQTILKEAGYRDIRARKLAEIGGDRISALRRHLLGLGPLPPYASWDSARQLSQAGLIGKWDGKNMADRMAIGGLLGKDYGEWIEILRADLLRSDTPLIQREEKWRLVARGEAWSALGNRITDEDLDRLQEMAVAVLGERDPIFDLPKEKRFLASLHGKQLEHSAQLREGLAESLALVGSKSKALSKCSPGKAEATAIFAIKRLLKNACWDRWASLEAQLPLLAEAAPDEFLKALESVLVDLNKAPFHEIFSQEGSDVLVGRNYMSGLLLALEALAWNPDHLSRVAVILADIASIDPGGKWTNRPANSLTKIFLPSHVQTTATFEKRKAAVKIVLREQSDIGWKLLLSLLPNNHSFTSGSHQPTWRNYIPRDWKDSVSRDGYWEQIFAYIELAVGLAKKDAEKLGKLIEYLDDLPRPARDSLLNHLMSQEVVDLPEVERFPFWENLNDLVKNHRKFPEANWALPEEEVAKIEEVANALAPKAPELKYQHLFSHRSFGLFDEEGDYEEQRKRLDEARQTAVITILADGGLKAVLRFAHKVASPNEVGLALGSIDNEKLEADILPNLLDTREDAEMQFVAGFVWARYWKFKWTWVDCVLTRNWSKRQKTKFLVFLPFEEEVWHRVANILGKEDELLYWRDVRVGPFGPNLDLTLAIEKLIKYRRASGAVLCIAHTLNQNSGFDESLATRALLAVLEEPSEIQHLEYYRTTKVIKHLQKSDTVNQDDLYKIEWNFLPWMDRSFSIWPITLEKRLASNPEFFAEVVSLVYRSNKVNQDDSKTDEQRRNLARNANALLNKWRRCPGILTNGSFNFDVFKAWLSKARQITEETGHGEIAKSLIGSVLIHAPSDPNGLWIHKAIATVLNGRDTKEMRSGFTTELYNQRGVYGFTAGKDELVLAKQYRDKAEALEAKGFSRFATALRELAKNYERDADWEANRNPYDD